MTKSLKTDLVGACICHNCPPLQKRCFGFSGCVRMSQLSPPQVCKYASMQVCKYASMQVCKQASRQAGKYALLWPSSCELTSKCNILLYFCSSVPTYCTFLCLFSQNCIHITWYLFLDTCYPIHVTRYLLYVTCYWIFVTG